MIQENISLKPYNSFGIQVIAQYFSEFNATDFLQSLLETIKKKSEFPTNSILVLGGGSNILFTKNFEGFVLKNNLKGIELVAEDDDSFYVKAFAGENWHQLVLHCLQNNWAGVENLSLIPGNVGASPMQNIGAYGVELKDVFYSLEALNIVENKIYSFSKSDCEFGYRESVFKNKFKNQFIILSVTFKLRKKAELNISYGAIEHELQNLQIQNVTIKDISNAVINIRNSKLPNPSNMGNAGSFFKNPSITKQQFLELKNKFPFISGYENTDGTYKIPAGWLIEQCGWKGYRKNNVGCYEKQALVLVNYGNASGLEIFKLSEEIINSVKKKFNIILTREVNIY